MFYTIRPERPEDFPRIRELVRLAFAQADHSDGDEDDLVERLRHSPEYIPELSLVAEQDGTIALAGFELSTQAWFVPIGDESSARFSAAVTHAILP